MADAISSEEVRNAVARENDAHGFGIHQATGCVVDRGRHGYQWRVWQDTRLPDGMQLLRGVIDNTTNIIEHPEVVAERIVRYAWVVGRDKVMAGVDCGFATGAGSTPVDERVARARLESLVAGARLASRELWANAEVAALLRVYEAMRCPVAGVASNHDAGMGQGAAIRR